MSTGRPRTASFESEEMIKLGKDLVEWATEETKDIRTSFCFWYGLKHGILLKTWKLMKQREDFRPYYERARAALAKKLHTQELEKGMSHRYIRMYDQELSENEDEKVKYDAEAKASATMKEVEAMSMVDVAKAASKGEIKQVD